MTEDLFQDRIRLAGTVENVRFQREETGFAVVEMSVRSGRNVTVVGGFPGVAAGERLQVQGHWEQNARFGRQFRAADVVVLPPTTTDGIVRYLSSGLIEGIGPVLAKRLVARFGERTLDVIETQRAKLLEVQGIGKVRQQRILAAWDKQRAVRKVMLFLSAHGVTPLFAHRIYQTYGNEAVELVRKNPFRLARDIFGIGFRSADEIARRLGLPEDHPDRLAAGLKWCLDEGAGQGHVCLPRDRLLESAMEVLGVDEGLLEPVVESLLRTGTLVQGDWGDATMTAPLVYSRSRDSTERELATNLSALISRRGNPALRRRLLTQAERAQKRLKLVLEGGQRDAVQQLLGQPFAVLTGGPGTGKTTILLIFLEALKAMKVKVALAAPTGRASQRMSQATRSEASTLHRLLEYSFEARDFQRNADQPLDVDVVVVDEASMLDQRLAHALVRALPPQGSLLLVGDADQLPSVGAGNVLYDLLQLRDVIKIRLTEVFRQSEASGIVRNAHRIIHGLAPEVPDKPNKGLVDFYQISVATPETVKARVLELVSNRIPSAFRLDPMRDVQVLAPMHRGECGISALNEALQARLNPNGRVIRFGDREFRVGDRVIQLRNNYQRKVFNGEIGVLTQFDAESGEIKVSYEDRRVIYDRADLNELALAYCISIHKSQGSEYPAVVIPMTTQHYIMLQRNLLYTAVTRARRLVCLVDQPMALRRAVKNDAPRHRFTGLRSRIERLLEG